MEMAHLAAILVEKNALSAGELDLALGFRGGAVAHGRAIAPGTNRIEDGTVFGGSRTFKD
jgi:hypothetical protein